MNKVSVEIENNRNEETFMLKLKITEIPIHISRLLQVIPELVVNISFSNFYKIRRWTLCMREGLQ